MPDPLYEIFSRIPETEHGYMYKRYEAVNQLMQYIQYKKTDAVGGSGPNSAKENIRLHSSQHMLFSKKAM